MPEMVVESIIMAMSFTDFSLGEVINPVAPLLSINYTWPMAWRKERFLCVYTREMYSGYWI